MLTTFDMVLLGFLAVSSTLGMLMNGTGIIRLVANLAIGYSLIIAAVVGFTFASSYIDQIYALVPFIAKYKDHTMLVCIALAAVFAISAVVILKLLLNILLKPIPQGGAIDRCLGTVLGLALGLTVSVLVMSFLVIFMDDGYGAMVRESTVANALSDSTAEVLESFDLDISLPW